MIETYTMVDLIAALRLLDVGGNGPGKGWWENRYTAMIERFGGKLFTKQQWLDAYAELVRNGPGYGRRGGRDYEYQRASRSWSWWTKRGAIIAISGVAV